MTSSLIDESGARVTALRQVADIDRVRDGIGVALIVSEFGDMIDHGSLARWVHRAQLFCITCAFVIPVGLFWAFTI